MLHGLTGNVPEGYGQKKRAKASAGRHNAGMEFEQWRSKLNLALQNDKRARNGFKAWCKATKDSLAALVKFARSHKNSTLAEITQKNLLDTETVLLKLLYERTQPPSAEDTELRTAERTNSSYMIGEIDKVVKNLEHFIQVAKARASIVTYFSISDFTPIRQHRTVSSKDELVHFHLDKLIEAYEIASERSREALSLLKPGRKNEAARNQHEPDLLGRQIGIISKIARDTSRANAVALMYLALDAHNGYDKKELDKKINYENVRKKLRNYYSKDRLRRETLDKFNVHDFGKK